MSTALHKRQDSNQGSPAACANVVLYHSDTPVLSVEQGTTFGLTKMLYESVGGYGQIIGLRQRENSSALVCIITQDQTILTEREYDIILHGKSKERSLDTKSSNYHDKNVNTHISVKPDAQIWPVYSFPTPRQIVWEKDIGNLVNLMETRAKDDLSWGERKDTHRNNNEGLGANNINTQIRQKIVPVTNGFEYMTSRKEMRIDCADQESEEIRGVSPRDSTSPSTTGTESPRGSTDQNSPAQAEQSRPHKRKWQCFYCKKFFVCRSAYENHERTHTGEKPFQCNVCGRCFGHQGNLKQHMHIHRDVKPHVCDVCGRGFTRSNRLRDHKRAHQYELYMRTKVQCTAAQNVTRDVGRAELSPVSSNAFEESATSDQETS